MYKNIHRAIKVLLCLTAWFMLTKLPSKIFTTDLKIPLSLSQYAQQTPHTSHCRLPDVVTLAKLFEKMKF